MESFAQFLNNEKFLMLQLVYENFEDDDFLNYLIEVEFKGAFGDVSARVEKHKKEIDEEGLEYLSDKLQEEYLSYAVIRRTIDLLTRMQAKLHGIPQWRSGTWPEEAQQLLKKVKPKAIQEYIKEHFPELESVTYPKITSARTNMMKGITSREQPFQGQIKKHLGKKIKIPRATLSVKIEEWRKRAYEFARNRLPTIEEIEEMSPNELSVALGEEFPAPYTIKRTKEGGSEWHATEKGQKDPEIAKRIDEDPEYKEEMVIKPAITAVLSAVKITGSWDILKGRKPKIDPIVWGTDDYLDLLQTGMIEILNNTGTPGFDNARNRIGWARQSIVKQIQKMMSLQASPEALGNLPSRSKPEKIDPERFIKQFIDMARKHPKQLIMSKDRVLEAIRQQPEILDNIKYIYNSPEFDDLEEDAKEVIIDIIAEAEYEMENL